MELNECYVCGNIPNIDGYLEHGRGCYVVNDDGGDFTYHSENDLCSEDDLYFEDDNG